MRRLGAARGHSETLCRPSAQEYGRLNAVAVAVAALLLWTPLAGASEGPVQIRVRVNLGIPYDGFVYQGRHWLRGTATSVSEDTLHMRAKDGGLVKVPIDAVTEWEVRLGDSGWHELKWKELSTEELRRELSLPAVAVPVFETASPGEPADGPELGERDTWRHSLYAELLGNAGIWSVNYEYQFRPNASFRLGFSSWRLEPWWGDKVEAVIIPVMVNYFVELTNSAHGEFGFGAGLGSIRTTERGGCFFGSCGAKAVARQEVTETSRIYLTGTVGVRIYSPSLGLLFRIGLTPVVGFMPEGSKVVPWMGISLGVAR